ncbi:MAG TPA: hypothetical protein VGH28_31800 [Polyangiaceae bacterium]|jgi:ribosomal protein S27AE
MADPLSPGADLAKVYGEETRCPSCGAFARVVPNDEHRWVCGVCGAPRVVMPAGEKLPEEAALALREAAAAQRNAALQRIITYLTAAPAAVGLLLAIVLAPASFVAAGVLVGMGVVLAVLASRASRRAATERKRVRTAVERANEAAIAALSTKNLSPAEVAAALKIPEAEVEAALAAGGIRVAVPTRIAEPAAATEPDSEPASAIETKSAAEKKS